MSQPRFIIGVDLGTTHTVVAYCDARGSREGDARPPITLFPIPQLVAPGQVAERPVLPSFLYQPAPGELSEAERSLGLPGPSPAPGEAVVGTLAARLGVKVEGRLVSSAKSWLSHASVDRSAPILPWGAAEGVPKLSPVAASAAYLAHVRATWDAAHPEHPMASQEVVLTLPASFDEGARALTLEAARAAGVPKLRLLEEPQAAFYDWLDRHHEGLEGALEGRRLALVVDVGGGTTDLTLIRVELRESGPRLTRVAVGEHTLLGGDNMDLSLARLREPELVGEGARLPAARFAQLVQQCRDAKEALLGPDAPEERSVTVLGGGARLVGGVKSARLRRDEVLASVREGFFPQVEASARPAVKRGGLVELGLPYVADPAITRHLAAFLARHQSVAAEAVGLSPEEAAADPARVAPDTVLLNGGVFHAEPLRARVLEQLEALRGGPVVALDNPDPDLAVARGAVAYGLARRGVGLRIGGGSPRSYFLELPAEGARRVGVCVLPRGSEEGEELIHRRQRFALKLGSPARFRLWASSADQAYGPLEEVALSEGPFHELPALAVVLEAKAGDGAELEVQLHATLTEVGTVELSCVATADPSRRYKLEFQARGEAPEATVGVIGQLHPRFREATEQLRAFYGKGKAPPEGRKIKTLRAELEKTLGPRQGWDSALSRELFGALLAGQKGRRRSADHERLFYHLAGYCLRPGYGYPLDEWRVGQLFPLFEQGVEFASDPAVYQQWWVLWRRVAGGLDEAQQLRLADAVAWYVEPQGRKPKPRPKGPRHLGLEEMVRLVGALERLPLARKALLGAQLLDRLEGDEVSHQALYGALGRLGARVPLYGSEHAVVSPELAAGWLERLLAVDLAKCDQAALAVAQLARRTDDRARDLDAALRERAARALEVASAPEAWARLVREGGALSAAEEQRVFGESLPAGLRLVEAS